MELNMDHQLIAPCGMYCALCSSYLANQNKIPRQSGKFNYCTGCRPRDKQCAGLKKRCDLLHNHTIQYCFECSSYPCLNLARLAKRYQTRYKMDFLQNLELIKRFGEDALLDVLYALHNCERCGELKSVHNGKCFKCDKNLSWKE